MRGLWIVGLVALGCDGGSSAALDAAEDAGMDAPEDVMIDAPLGLHSLSAYVKASNTDAIDRFGDNLAMSDDGTTLIVAAPRESSNAVGIDGDQTNNEATRSGAVYVFVRGASGWTQQAYLKASNSDMYDEFGTTVALSGDGNTLAVSSYYEASCSPGVNGDENDDSCPNPGAVYVFVRNGGTWTQQAYLKANVNTIPNLAFGAALSLSTNGNTLVVGAPADGSDATGINGDETHTAASLTGAAHVFERSGSSWTRTTYLKASNAQMYDVFGREVAISGDGTTIAVGAIMEASGATGVGGSQLDNGVSEAGAVYVFERMSTTWMQRAYVKASNTGTSDQFGHALALSADGTTLVVGAPFERSNATGIDGDQSDDSELHAGAVYVFTKSTVWSQQAYVKGAFSNNANMFGFTVALSPSGDKLAVSAPGDSHGGTGVTTPMPIAVGNSGTAYLFARTGGSWSMLNYIKATNPGEQDVFGFGLAIGAEGAVFAASAPNEDSSATGVGGDQASNAAMDSGAVYVFE